MPRTGRPPKLDDPVPGRPGTTIADAICQRVEAVGCTPRLAGRELGIDPDTVAAWLKHGQAAADKLAKNLRWTPLTRQEQRYYDFLGSVNQAQARHEQGLLALHATLERGGSFDRDPTTGELRMAGGEPIPRGAFSETMTTKRTADGGVEVTRKIELRLPDRQAIEWALERKGSENYRQRVEVTGADGDPLIPDADDDAKQLAALEAAIEAFARGHRAGMEDAHQGVPSCD